MICKKCGNQVPDHAKFCNKCGEPVTPPVQQKQVQQKPVQQRPQPQMRPQQPSKTPSQPPEKKKNSVGLIIGLVIAVIVIAVLVVWAIVFFVTRKTIKPDVERPETVVQTEASEDVSVQEAAPLQETDAIQEAAPVQETEVMQETTPAQPSNDAQQAEADTVPASSEAFLVPDSEWVLLEHGIACLAAAIEDKCAVGQTINSQDLTQTDLNRYLVEFMRFDYGQTYINYLPVTGDNSNQYLHIDDAANLIAGFTGRYDYTPTPEDMMFRDGELMGFPKAAGAPINVARQYAGSISGNKVTLYVEIGELANIYSAVRQLYEVQLTLDPASICGYRIDAMKRLPDSVDVASVVASSKLVDDGNNAKYQPANVIDHDMNTAWVEGAAGLGEYEWIQLQLSGTQKVHGLRIGAGYFKSDRTYSENASPVSILVEFSDGTQRLVNLEQPDIQGFKSGNDTVSLGKSEVYAIFGMGADRWDYTKDFMTPVSFGEEIETSYVKVYLYDIKRGTAFEDTCITEIDLY